MNVKLLRVTEKGINLVAEAARISGVSSIQTAKGIIELITDNDYSSALEHIHFTFDISEISVALSRELLEHRIASHTARSTRYMEEQGFSYYVPRELEEREGGEGEVFINAVVKLKIKEEVLSDVWLLYPSKCDRIGGKGRDCSCRFLSNVRVCNESETA